ncbi:MAG: protein-tyrosine phosphatase family protein [Chloroflexota bacterium]
MAIMPRPRAGEWLEDELAAWKKAGVTAIVSTLTPLEVWELNLGNEPNICEELGINFISFPIHDRQIPSSTEQAVKGIKKILDLLRRNDGVAIHCRMGVGRSAMLAGAILAQQGTDRDKIFKLIAQARGIEVPDTEAQKHWVFNNFPNAFANFEAKK